MSREEAIKEIKEYRCVSTEYDTAFDIALDVAVEALEQEQCGDCINREDAIKAAIEGADIWDGGCNVERNRCITKEINKLHPVSPMPKMGRWIKYITEVGVELCTCSVCRSLEKDRTAYCPSCGARMGVEE